MNSEFPLMPQSIHAYLRARRRRPDYDESAQAQTTKEYPRMPRVELPACRDIDTSLSSALTNRESYRTCVPGTLISLDDVSTILGNSLRETVANRRPYPSGGAKYPIETYLIARGINSLPRGIFHYAPKTHALEHLWDIPVETHIFSGSAKDEWAEHAPAIVVFTALWERSYVKYGDFSYLLTCLEAGHMAQNILLTAGALNIGVCPMAGFNDSSVGMLLDIDASREQAVHSVVLCTR